VQSTLTMGMNGDVRGQLRLAGARPLRDALIVVGASAQQLGDLQPGSQVEVDLRADLQNFPDGLSVSASEVINRALVLNNIFNHDRFALDGPNFQGVKGLPDLNGVYLLGWDGGVPIEARIDGDPGRQQGETLYLIRLNAGR
jgi:hypothetical protein